MLLSVQARLLNFNLNLVSFFLNQLGIKFLLTDPIQSNKDLEINVHLKDFYYATYSCIQFQLFEYNYIDNSSYLINYFSRGVYREI
jgi:hypothetical protein